MTIDWRPIYEAKGTFRDGRTLWLKLPTYNEPCQGFYQDSGPQAGGWETDEGEIVHPTHFATMNPST